MAGWDEILKEIRTNSPFDDVRRKYLKELFELTGRNTIVYYSSFLSKSNVVGLDINDNDMTGFMNAVKSLDCSKGLDLILHTPGGDPVATESIVNYLKQKFVEFRVIVPHMAMSAGTLISFAAKEIVMGKQSSLGPVDPQINGIPALSIVEEYIDADDDLSKNPNKIGFWSLRLNKYPPGFMKIASNSIALSEELAKKWLSDSMFKDEYDPKVISDIIAAFNENKKSKTHSRHFNIEYCRSKGLKIVQLEDDQKLQDAVLSLHHALMITLGDTNNVKIIENHNGKAWIITKNS